jgi:hypothetical protein
MRNRYRALVLALLGLALAVGGSGCAGLLEFEQRKNEWLRETFFGGKYSQDQFYCCDPGY